MTGIVFLRDFLLKIGPKTKFPIAKTIGPPKKIKLNNHS